jgi:hypothetical protein
LVGARAGREDVLLDGKVARAVVLRGAGDAAAIMVAEALEGAALGQLERDLALYRDITSMVVTDMLRRLAGGAEQNSRLSMPV